MKSPVSRVCVLVLWTLMVVLITRMSYAAAASDTNGWAKGVYSSVVQVKVTKPTLKLTLEAAKKQAITSILTAFGKTPINSFVSGQDLLKYAKLRALLEKTVSENGRFKSVTLKVAGVHYIKVSAEIPTMKLLLPALDFYRKLGSSDGNTKSLIMKITSRHTDRIMAEKSMDEKSVGEELSVGPYTSLIVDASGLGLKRAMSPKIRREDKSEVWGTVEVDADFVLETGIVSYTASMAGAIRDPRAGDNPLVIQAIGISGGKFLCDPVISDGDAKNVLDEEKVTHFLEKFNVIFIAN
ncbi:MAG: hypothetical protein ACYC1M_07750 [Armatimonadota bacterium]